MSYNKIGAVLVAQGELSAALKNYKKALAIAKRLVAADGSNAGWRFNLGVGHERIGEIQVAQRILWRR